MKTLSAKNANYGFGRLVDLDRAEPVTTNKHGRPVVVVMVVQEFERPTEWAKGTDPAPKTTRAARRSQRTFDT